MNYNTFLTLVSNTIPGRPEFFDQNGDIGSDGKVFLQKWMNSYISWIKENYKTRDPL